MLKQGLYHIYLILRILAFDEKAAERVNIDPNFAKASLFVPIIISLFQTVLYSLSDVFTQIMPGQAWFIYSLYFNTGWLIFLGAMWWISRHLDRERSFTRYAILFCWAAPLQFIILFPLLIIRTLAIGGDFVQSLVFSFVIVFIYILHWSLIRAGLNIKGIAAIGFVLMYDLFVDFLPGLMIALHLKETGVTLPL